MNFMELSRARYSVRNYAATPVEAEKLNLILEAGRIAPTAANKQPQKIYVLQSEAALARMRAATRMMYNAPLALLVCYDDTQSWKATVERFGEDYEGGEVDAAIVATAMMMEATELGLGTLWARGFNAAAIAAAADLPDHIHPVCLLLLGYPADGDAPGKMHTMRKPPEETITTL
jgi:nitroreductase